MLKIKKKQYYYNKIDKNKNNSKLMWKTLKTLVNGTDRTFTQKSINFSYGGNQLIASSDQEIAEGFNAFFVLSIDEIRSTIPTSNPWSPNIMPGIDSQFCDFSTLSMNDLKKIVNSLENKYNNEDILNIKVLKSSFHVLGHVFLKFVNTSLLKGEFPNELKTSLITPIPKVANSTDCSNYRPINTLPAVEKILELAVYNQLYAYFSSNNLLFINQSGFRSKHSCESAIQLTVSTWNELIDQGYFVSAIFLDFRRAFETIDRDILLQKLRYYGIGGTVLNWLQDFLTDRYQITKVNSVKSSRMLNQFGVPQGSVLGPLLFIIYLNDISHFVNPNFLNLFADDSLISCSDKDLNVAIRKTQRELDRIEQYLNINKLKLNVDKTKAMILTTKYKYSQINTDILDISIYGSRIEIVTKIKYLGFYIDNLLTYKDHFEYIKKKIGTKLFFFSRIAGNLSMNSRLLVYQTIIQPHFNYCSSLLYLLDNNCKASLQKLQNRGMRIILRCNRYTPIYLMLQCLEWRSVRISLKYYTMTFIFKILHNLLPSYLRQTITRANEIHNHFTRYSTHIYIRKTNLKRAMNCLFFKCMNEYNKLPTNVKESNSLAAFKRTLAAYLKR